MSRRRDARRVAARYVATEDGIPAALADPADPLWTDQAAVLALAHHHRLDVDLSRADSEMRDPVWERFRAFRAAFARAHNLTRDRYPLLPDPRKIAAAGIYRWDRPPIDRTDP